MASTRSGQCLSAARLNSVTLWLGQHRPPLPRTQAAAPDAGSALAVGADGQRSISLTPTAGLRVVILGICNAYLTTQYPHPGRVISEKEPTPVLNMHARLLILKDAAHAFLLL